jgi:hypothetical protein
MLELVQYRTKLTQSDIFLVRYRTELVDAGIPMPELVFLMPMPSYGSNHVFAADTMTAGNIKVKISSYLILLMQEPLFKLKT